LISPGVALMPLIDQPFPVYVTRHGETAFNAQGRYQGARDDSPLTIRGRQHAFDVALLLRDVVNGGKPPHFVTSPLGRATTTTQLILQTLSLPEDSYTTDFRIREIDLGDWSGRVIETLKVSDATNWQKRETDKWNIPVPGGESYADVAKRAADWFASLTGPTVAISHGGFGRILRGLYKGLSWQEMSALDEPYGTIFCFQNGKIARIGAPPSGKLR
jgi:probable phosphoglycerate mutase